MLTDCVGLFIEYFKKAKIAKAMKKSPAVRSSGSLCRMALTAVWVQAHSQADVIALRAATKLRHTVACRREGPGMPGHVFPAETQIGCEAGRSSRGRWDCLGQGKGAAVGAECVYNAERWQRPLGATDNCLKQSLVTGLDVG